MLERDYLVNFNLSMQSQQCLYRKAENARLAKALANGKKFASKTIVGTLGTVVVILVSILIF